MEFEELISCKVQTLQPSDATKCLEDDDWAADGRKRGEIVAA